MHFEVYDGRRDIRRQTDNNCLCYDKNLTAFKKVEVVLCIIIALKNPSLSARFEPANLGSSGKLHKHYTTENDFPVVKLRSVC
jgi:hypothetical protein